MEKKGTNVERTIRMLVEQLAYKRGRDRSGRARPYPYSGRQGEPLVEPSQSLEFELLRQQRRELTKECK